MVSPANKPDIQRLALCLGLALPVGLASGQVFFCLFVATLVFLICYYRALCGFLNFIRHGAEDKLSDLPGIINDLVREFELLRSHYRQREGRLSDFLSRFQEATAALPDAIVVLNEGGNIAWANDLAARYLGVHWPQDSGQRLANLIRHPDMAAFIRRKQQDPADAKVLVLSSPVNQQLSVEIRVQGYGERHLLLVARDITELERINKMRKDFIANASHELRSPLTVIAGYLEVFDETTDGCPPAWQAPLSQMRVQAGRMERLIDDLLQLSSLESANDEGLDGEINMAELLAGVCSEAQTLSGEKQHRISLELDQELCLRGNQRDMYSAFSNIVFNAVQYTPAGSAVHISWQQDEEGAHLAVRDSGEGIAAEHIPRLTERFYRADAGRSREKGGTGLGLAIVKHALARHNAVLEIESEPGVGSTFRCRFPAQRIIRPAATEGLRLSG